MTTSAFYNRVVFLTTSAGTGAFTILQAAPGGRMPSDVPIPNGTAVSYTAVSANILEWECGQGVYNSGTLTRAIIRDSSSGGSTVNFGLAPTVQLDYLAQDIIAVQGSISQSGNPPSSTDNAIVRWDGITGQIVQNSNVTIDDTGNIFFPTGTKLDWGSGNYTLTHSSGQLLTSGVFAVGDANFKLNLNGSLPLLTFDSGDQIQYDRAGNNWQFQFASVSKFIINSTAIFPASSGGIDLGITSTNPWGNAFFKAGGKIDWANGGITITESSDQLQFGGASANPAYSFDAGSTTNSVVGVTSNSKNLHLMPNAGSGAFNGLTSAGDQVLVAAGSGGIDSGILTLVPWATATVGVRINSSTVSEAGAYRWQSILTPSQITADQNDYSPSGIGTATVLRLDSNALRNITGLNAASNTDGRLIAIHYIGANSIVLKDESSSSSSGNKFALTSDVTLLTDQCVLLQYDLASLHWRMLGSSYLAPGFQTLTDAATIVWNTANGRSAQVTLTASGHAMGAPSNLADGECYVLHVLQDTGAPRTMTWNGVFKWPGGVAPVLTSTNSARDVFTFTALAGNLYGTWMNDVK